jgi:hypothetical protein
MRATERRPIDWAERAPLVVQATATSAAPPDAVFAVLADHERWPEWFRNVKRVEVTGPREGVGAQRRVHVPGAAFEEEFIVWDVGSRWSFTVTAARPRILRALVEDCRLTSTDGGTHIDYRMCFEPTTWSGPVMRLLAGQMRRQLQGAVDELARRAAHRAP